MFHNFLTNENRRDYNQKNENNITLLSKRDIMPKYTNIKKEIKKRTNDLRKCFNIKNTIFKEMQSKENSLTYKELKTLLGKYFFGPNGIVTEKYKFLRDYYEEKNMKIGLDNRIYAGTLDYFFLLSQYNSYSQKLNFTKEKLLSLSNHLAIASSAFDKINQKAINKTNYIKRYKNFIYLNKKNAYSADKNTIKNSDVDTNNNKQKSSIKTKYYSKDNTSYINSTNNTNNLHIQTNNNYLKNINNISYIFDTKSKTHIDLYNKFNKHNGRTNNLIKKRKIFFLKRNNKNNNNNTEFKNNNYQLSYNPIDITPETSLSNSQQRNSFFNNSLTHRYSNKSNINILKQKLKNNNPQNNIINFSSSFPKIKKDYIAKDQNKGEKKIIESYSGFFPNNIKVTLEEKITPILIMNQTSYKNLSDIKYHQLNSKNEKEIKKIIKTKTIMSILRDKEYYDKINNIRTPNLNNIELPNKIKNLILKKNNYEEYL